MVTNERADIIGPRSNLLEAATEAWKSGSGETDAWSRAVLRELLRGTSTPEAVARSVYAAIKPQTARGALASPKIKDGKLSVRSLENTTNPVPGAAAARKNLQTVLELYEHREAIAAELEAFTSGNRDWKLYGLAALLKSR
tara:strand:+ start:25 stop:447 length:423 start_codon:yes stop_codon:yes gene_type:complete